MARLLAVSAQEECRRAVNALDCMTRWNGDVTPLRISTGRHVEITWHDGGTAGLERRVRSIDEALSAEVSMGLPRRSREAEGVSGGTILWAVIENPQQLKRARWFRPRPTVALKKGESSWRLLVWALTERLDYYSLRQANRRLAYRFGAVLARGEPDGFWMPLPGTCLHVGRKRPCLVSVARLRSDAYAAREVVGALKDPPEYDLRELLAART